METEGFNLITFISQFVTAENIWNLLAFSGVAAVVQAYISSKSSHKNKFIKFVDQLVRDLINIVAFNFGKAKNEDDR